MTTRPVFAIRLRRLAGAPDASPLVSVSIVEPGDEGVARRIGTLTDAALRGRLAHWNIHSANDVAVLRKALADVGGEATVYEGWPELMSCWRFWRDYVGSRIRPVEWSCDGCHGQSMRQLGARIGETILLPCRCGTTRRMTVGEETRAAATPSLSPAPA